MPKSETLGSRLAQERREKAARDREDLSSAAVAKVVGVSPATYSRYEADLTKPDDGTLEKMARFFGVTRSWLRFGEGERYAAPKTPIIKEREAERDITAAHQPRATAKRAAGARGPRNR